LEIKPVPFFFVPLRRILPFRDKNKQGSSLRMPNFSCLISSQHKNNGRKRNMLGEDDTEDFKNGGK